MLMKDLPRATVARPNGEIVYSDDGVQLKRISLNMIFPEATVTVTPEITQGTLIATMGINGNRVQLYAPESNPNAITGVRVNGRDVVRDHVADISIPVTDVKLNGSSVVRNRTAEINIPDLPEQFVEDVVDPNGVSLVDENHVAHVGGSGSGDVVDVVDDDGVSLLDGNKIAHVPGTTGYVIQPTLDYARATVVPESTSWTTTQVTWTAPEDCAVFFEGVYYYLYQLIGAANADWMYGCGILYSLFGRTLIPLKKDQEIKFSIKSYTSGSQKLYYIPYKKKSFFKADLCQPWVDYSDIRTVTFTSNITESYQIVADYTAPKDGIFLPYLNCSSSRYEMQFKINDVEFESYNKCVSSEIMLDIFDGIPLSKGDNIKITYGSLSSATLTGKVKFFPFATCSDYTELKSPIPDYENWTRISNATSLLNTTLNNSYYINQKYADGSTTGNYPITISVTGVTDNYTIDSRFAYLGSSYTYDEHRPGRMIASGIEEVTETPSFAGGQNYIYEIPLVTAEVEREESGGGSDVEGNPLDPSTDTLTRIKIDNNIYSIRELMNFCYDKGENGITGRLDTPNIEVANRLVYFLATSAMNSSGLKPGNRDGHVLHIPWDGTNVNLSTQFAISHGDNPQAWIRSQNNGTWTQWFNLPRTKLNAQMAASKALCTSSDSNIETSNTTSTELEYLSGTRANVQNQIDTINTINDGSAKVNILPNFNTLLISNKYTTATLTSKQFDFSINDSDNTWSSSATIYNATAIDLTNYEYLEIDISITERTGYGAFWVTLSDTLYTWAGNRWPTVYANKDSSIKITESGTYVIDVTQYTGNYYIYFGPTTGKDTTAHGDCVNTNNGTITGYVSSIKRVQVTGRPNRTRVLLYSGTAATAVDSDLNLTDHMSNYDELEIYSSAVSYYDSQIVNVSYFMTNFPYNPSATSSAAYGSYPHFLISPYSGNFYRAIVGQTDNKIRIWGKSGSPIIRDIYGIKY